MAAITILDKNVADRIAAGEVVERPASVVKELMENAIDAGAANIRMSLEKGGQDLIEVADDGNGMTGGEIRLAIQRFATSKIRDWEDLESLNTFGFRGEALPSIASISRMEILSRPADSPSGYRVLVEGGDLAEEGEAGIPQGTQVRVRDLFYNTPARRKFLKSPPGETAHIIGIAQKLSLVNPDLSVRLTSNGRELLDFPSSMSLRERILKIWGLPLDYLILPIEYDSPFVQVSGFACPPDQLKSHRSYQLFFVNGRYVKNTMMSQALAEGFSPLVPGGKFPMALVFINMPGTDLDVNVHPNKMEVRFLKPGQVFKAVRDAVRAQMARFAYAPRIPDPLEGLGLDQGFAREEFSPPGRQKSAPGTGGGPWIGRERDAGPGRPASYENQAHYPSLPLGFEEAQPRPAAPAGESPGREAGGVGFQALAQVQKTYIVGRAGDEIWIIDQHTAHERINYEKLASFGRDMSRSQRLLFPVVLELPAALFNFVRGQAPLFEEMGLEIEPFGGNSVLVKSVPFGFDRLEKKERLMEILEDLAGEHPHRNREEFLEGLRARMACRASVKAGDSLGVEEMNSLVNELMGMDYSLFCPHGRPVLIRLTGEHLDRMFHRK